MQEYVSAVEFPRPRRISNIEIYAADNLQTFEDNQCLSHITRGYSTHHLSGWMGHRIVIGFSKATESGILAYRDVTLNDLRAVVNSYSQKFTVFEDEKENPFVIRDESKWIKAVKVSCEGDVELLGKAKYRQIEIKKNHPIFHHHDDISSVSKHKGWTLLAQKCPTSPKWASPSFDPCFNPEALYIVVNANLTAPISRFGMVDFPKWDRS